MARYSGRTLETYRYDLRSFFQWTADVGLEVLCATRPHIELFRSALKARGLAAATLDRRLSTVCGFYRFAHIDGRIGSNPTQYVRRPTVHRPEGRGLDRRLCGGRLRQRGVTSPAEVLSDRTGTLLGVRMSWTHASRRHGIARHAARFVVEHCGLVYIQPAPPHSPVPDPRLVFLGDDETGRAIEVIGVEMEVDAKGEDHLRVIHAMALREKYRQQYEEAKKWRV